MDTLDFFFEGLAVGIFAAPFPRQPGLHRYEPYRGTGHYRLMTLLRGGRASRCYYEIAGQRFVFTVLGCPGYGVLELSGFDPPVPPA